MVNFASGYVQGSPRMTPRRMAAPRCTDPLIGNILAGWRYDISRPPCPAMRTDYDQHLCDCAHCRRRQHVARTIDVLLISVSLALHPGFPAGRGRPAPDRGHGSTSAAAFTATSTTPPSPSRSRQPPSRGLVISLLLWVPGFFPSRHRSPAWSPTRFNSASRPTSANAS